LFSYSQACGHGRAFITNAQVQLPAFEWGELTVVLTGYSMIVIPWLLLNVWPILITPPYINFGVGLILLALGLALRQDSREAR
jgi:hypothetical protein